MKTKKARYQQGNIRKVSRASGFAWEVRFSETVNGERTQQSLYFKSGEYPTQASVKKAIQLQVAQVNTNSERSKVDAKFGVITALYRSEHLPGLRHSTQEKNAYLLKDYIEPRWAGEPIRDVTPLEVLRWLSGLGGLAPSTKGQLRSLLSQCFVVAALHGYVPANDRNPMSLVMVKGTTKRERQPIILTPEQFNTLVAALPNPVNVMALIAGYLGLRCGEFLALHWEDIDWKEKTITIQRNFTHGEISEVKTDSSGALLPLDGELIGILKQYRTTLHGSELVFPSSRTGGYRHGTIILQKTLQPISTKLGLGKVTWHDLRHSCRTWLDARGVPMGLQKDLLRHSDISTTMNRYGRSLQPDMRAAHLSIMGGLVPDAMKI